MENNFSNHFFIVIMTVSSQLLLTAFVLATTTWYAGFALLLQAEFQLFTISMLGTMLSAKVSIKLFENYDKKNGIFPAE